MHLVAPLAVVEAGQRLAESPLLFLVQDLIRVGAYGPPQERGGYPLAFDLVLGFLPYLLLPPLRTVALDEPPLQDLLRDGCLQFPQLVSGLEGFRSLRRADHVLRVRLPDIDSSRQLPLDGALVQGGPPAQQASPEILRLRSSVVVPNRPPASGSSGCWRPRASRRVNKVKRGWGRE